MAPTTRAGSNECCSIFRISSRSTGSIQAREPSFLCAGNFRFNRLVERSTSTSSLSLPEVAWFSLNASCGAIHKLAERPDQAPPRHGGNNYVALPFPDPAERLVAYRTNNGRVGVFFALRGEGAEALFETLRAEAETLSREVGRELRFEAEAGRPRWHIGASENVSAAPPNGESRQYEWLKQTVNSFVRVFRRRLA